MDFPAFFTYFRIYYVPLDKTTPLRGDICSPLTGPQRIKAGNLGQPQGSKRHQTWKQALLEKIHSQCS